METKQLKRQPVGIETFSAYWHNMKTLTWRCAHPLVSGLSHLANLTK